LPRLAAAMLLATALLCAGAAGAEPLRGRVSVIDGDTLEMHGQRIRLFGIDAPESGQRCSQADGRQWRCGREAAFALDGLVQGHTVTCVGRDSDRWGRIIAVCDIEGVDLGQQMVESGWAIASSIRSSMLAPPHGLAATAVDFFGSGVTVAALGTSSENSSSSSPNPRSGSSSGSKSSIGSVGTSSSLAA
jgi:endonuclease YncB( thermonuclease family)